MNTQNEYVRSIKTEIHVAKLMGTNDLLRSANDLLREANTLLRKRMTKLEAERDEAVVLLETEHDAHHFFCCATQGDLCRLGQFLVSKDT